MIHFPFVPNGKLMILDVPMLKHIGVIHYSSQILLYDIVASHVDT